MSSCLFECLKEAGLESYYSSLRGKGFDTAFSLLYLRPADFQKFGINTDSDRQRFLQLVQIIASFHQGGELSPRRQRSPDPKRTPRTDQDRGDFHNIGSLVPIECSFSSDLESETSTESFQDLTRSRRKTVKHTSGLSLPGVRNDPFMPPDLPRVRNYNTNNHNAYVLDTSSSTTRKEFFSMPRSSAAQAEGSSFSHDRNSNVDKRSPRPRKRAPLPMPVLPEHRPANRNTLMNGLEAENAEPTENKNVLKVCKIAHTGDYNYGLPNHAPAPNYGRAVLRTPGAKYPSPTVNITQRDDFNTPHSSARDDSPRYQRRITVCVRKRPMVPTEAQAGGFDVVTTNREGGGKEGGLVVHELKHTVDMSEFVQQFDKVFDERADNKDVYSGAVRQTVDWIMTQSNRATCFGYGQTGAGKTHTLLGNDQEPGVFLYAAKDMLSRLSSHSGRQNRNGKREFSLYMSLYEIYCSRIFDLLNDHKRLQALEDSNKQIHIHGLKLVPIGNIQTLIQVLHQGLSTRSVGVTGANQDSSRSHAIVQLTIKDSKDKEFSRLSFIDLAGSERACDALRDSDKQNRLEGAEINQSLLALKECIRSLDRALAHTPFRQSKLTQVLRDSFLGNSRTCMIANISPSHSSLEHTMNTLRYASRVKDLHRRPGASTPRRKRACPGARLQQRNDRQRPHTADPTAYRGSGHELSRTPPPGTNEVDPLIAESFVSTEGQLVASSYQIAPSMNASLAFVSCLSPTTRAKTPQHTLRKTSSIFTSEAIGCSSTPNKNDAREGGEQNAAANYVASALQEAEETGNATETSLPPATPRFLHDTKPVGGMVVSASTRARGADDIGETSNTLRDVPTLTTEIAFGEANKISTKAIKSSSLTDGAIQTNSGQDSSSLVAGSTKEADGITGRSDSKINCSRENRNTSTEENISRKQSKSQRSSLAEYSQQQTTTTSNITTNAVFASDTPISTLPPRVASVVGQSEAGNSPPVLPQSRKSTGLPSPKKFLSYMKDKHNMKKKHLKQKLKDARKREHLDPEAKEEEECQVSSTSDLSATGSLRNVSNPSTSRRDLTTALQQQHLTTENTQSPHGIVVTNMTTPPRLPSPKLDRSLPRHSRSSSRSHSPSSGRNTPSEKASTSSQSPSSTTTGVTSASELHARLAKAAASIENVSDDNDNATLREKPHPSTSAQNVAGNDSGNASRADSSSDKENFKDSAQEKIIKKAQSQVVIAHQEHISEILRISIEEERLYNELRDHWGKGTSFQNYTKALHKLLARKMQSINALKVQLALYDRVRQAPL